VTIRDRPHNKLVSRGGDSLSKLSFRSLPKPAEQGTRQDKHETGENSTRLAVSKCPTFTWMLKSISLTSCTANCAFAFIRTGHSNRKGSAYFGHPKNTFYLKSVSVASNPSTKRKSCVRSRGGSCWSGKNSSKTVKDWSGKKKKKSETTRFVPSRNGSHPTPLALLVFGSPQAAHPSIPCLQNKNGRRWWT
jgi:hypothetical protein